MNEPLEISRPAKDNFDAVRIWLAANVVFAHSVALTQLKQLEILEITFDSNFAVKGFFCLSGFLVTQSYLKSRDWADYANKRFRRIYPAYIASILLCFIIGLGTTSLQIEEFITSRQTIWYLLSNAGFLNFLQPTLPGVFTSNPMSHLNVSLWTIKVEVMLYACTPCLVYLFKRFGSIKTSLALYVASTAWIFYFSYIHKGNMGDELARQFPGQLAYFTAGALLAANKKIYSHLKWLALASAAAVVMTTNYTMKLALSPITYSSIVIYLSTSAFKNLGAGRWGDVSYGLYLYHAPIIQTLIFLGVFAFNPWLGMLSALIVTGTISLASWHLIEKRFLRRTSHYIVAST